MLAIGPLTHQARSQREIASCSPSASLIRTVRARGRGAFQDKSGTLPTMPLVTIETRAGLCARDKRLVFEAIHRALVEAFKIPAHDRAQRMVEYADGDFEIPPGRSERYMLISIEVFAGRSVDAKRSLYREIVSRLASIGIAPADVLIVLREIPVENWGLRGGVAACDLDLGFEIRV
jgi:phenylpyruvate tautomerase PptA (4-oxalocrotonate tautomerase family)